MDKLSDTNKDQTLNLNLSSLTSPNPDSGLSSYRDYPATQPFINSDFRRVDGPINAYPISERDAVISALRSLQQRFKHLELERNQAEQSLQSLASETEQYKMLLSMGKQGQTTESNAWEQTGEDARLSATAQRSQLLERQLEQMRKMVETSEKSRWELMEQIKKIQETRDTTGADVKVQLARLRELEMDQRRLTLTQTIAESKIRELEQKLREEKQLRETLQERTAQLESVAVSRSPKSPEAANSRTRKSKKKKKKKQPLQLTSTSDKLEPHRHFRLNLAEIPFVAGQSTGPSHSLGANVQNVLAMLKLHNAALCSAADELGQDLEGSETQSQGTEDSMTFQELSRRLSHLQDEFGHLSSKHQDILDHLHLTRDGKVKAILEQELSDLLKTMEHKCNQILNLRQRHKKMENSRMKRPFTNESIQPNQTQPSNLRSQVHHLNRNRNCRLGRHYLSANSKVRAVSASPGRTNLGVLREVQKLKCRLQKEDLYWD